MALPGRFQALLRRSRLATVALVAAGLVGVLGTGALAVRATSERFADAALAKLGGDPDQILDQIASRVVDQLMDDGGAVDEAQSAIIAELAGAAGKKLDGVDTTALLRTVEGQVVAAGLGKLDGISTDAIVDEVTKALIAVARAELEGLDLEALARGVLDELAASIDLNALVSDQLSSLDVEALVGKAIAEQLTGSGSGSLQNLLGLFLGR